MLLGCKVLELVLQLLDLIVDCCNFKMVLSIIWFLEGLLRHRRNDRLIGHEEIVSALTPDGLLILNELRVVNALCNVRLILMLHRLAFLFKHLFLTLSVSLLLFFVLVAIISAFCLTFLFFFDFFSIDYGRLWLILATSVASGSTFSLFTFHAIFGSFGISTVATTTSRLGSLSLLLTIEFGRSSLSRWVCLSISLGLLTILFTIRLASTSVLSLSLIFLLLGSARFLTIFIGLLVVSFLLLSGSPFLAGGGLLAWSAVVLLVLSVHYSQSVWIMMSI